MSPRYLQVDATAGQGPGRSRYHYCLRQLVSELATITIEKDICKLVLRKTRHLKSKITPTIHRVRPKRLVNQSPRKLMPDPIGGGQRQRKENSKSPVPFHETCVGCIVGPAICCVVGASVGCIVGTCAPTEQTIELISARIPNPTTKRWHPCIVFMCLVSLNLAMTGKDSSFMGQCWTHLHNQRREFLTNGHSCPCERPGTFPK